MTPASVFTKIVCGVDRSPQGLEAVKQAQRLARNDSELTLVSVNESHLAVRTGPAAPEWAQRLNAGAQAALEGEGDRRTRGNDPAARAGG